MLEEVSMCGSYGTGFWGFLFVFVFKDPDLDSCVQDSEHSILKLKLDIFQLRI